MKFWLLLFGLVGVAAVCPSDTTYDSIMDRCYKYVTSPMASQQAEQFCLESGGLLLNVLNATENLFIAEDAKQGVNPYTNYWIGLSNLGGPWTWDDGRRMTYSNWAVGEPANNSGHCVYSHVSTALWYTSACTDLRASVCAYDANPSTTSRPSTTPGPKCAKNMEYYEGTNMCYYVGSSAEFWSAENMCNELGGHLTSIHNAFENSFVVSLTTVGGTLSAEQMTWIGLHYSGSDWMWTDGSPDNYLFWEPGQPTDTKKYPCVQLLQDDYVKKKNARGMWNNQPCSYTMRKFVCKIPPLW